ncbi:16S rRNA (adenine(1518)-N(6)/adenine(1519)-N(6))-dimethyltransferase RsmA [Oceanomicrobium pacificus]|uniref:Ribosomal RNA small subunit methyltransferase A n=1 Tax=Oceanomicrobium pacificus TaxID=2692916 RepID=A0A6B0TVX3_9RHOB|nr:16S rRNA (adenine(1518)-N(6)/adenine(1519)-N(6))-dimethyltransferase RsmA [Oceanomicrobium pacificus]MXU65708.1 16S rRNA (adenine(1518)-N(6)/adenine(1519)-N(6))-dimethyltransferase RsmA [Oceanomicrobium pacificus]
MSAAQDGLPPLREVIAAHGLSARKSLGQNFLLDLNLTSKIARQVRALPDHDVLEIGPGPGGLTRGLLFEGARKVVAVERDHRCIPALQEVAAAYPGRLEVIEGDALEIDPLDHLSPPIAVAANLPYNIGTELLVRWLTPSDWPPFWSSLTLMFQREVAQRIVAKPGSKAYGRLSILAQWRTDAKIVLDLPPAAFTPPPKVSSAVVHLTALPEPRFEADADILNRVVAAAFGQRRKMLRAALKPLGVDPVALLDAAGIPPTARAETVSVEEFCRLSRTYAEMRGA